MYKTLRNIVLAGVMSAVGSGCVVTPGAMTYGAHLTNPGNAHIANAHGFAVLGDQGYRLAKAKENNYGRGSRDYENKEERRDLTWAEATAEALLNDPLEKRIEYGEDLLKGLEKGSKDYNIIKGVINDAKLQLREREK